MLLFEDSEPKPDPPKPELTPTTAYLDPEHVDMLNALLAAGKGQLNKSEAIRQCIRLGFRTMKQKSGAA